MNEIEFPDGIPGYRNWLEVVRTYNVCEQVITERCREEGLTLAQHDVLATLLIEGPLQQNELARHLLVAKSNVTAVLGRMERDGLVERRPDPDDGRAKQVAPTDEGRRRAQATMAAQQEVARGMIGQLSPDECATLGDMMRRVRAYLKSLPVSS